MPTYNYKSKKCNKIKEVFHSMSEVGNISEETIEKLRCKGCACTEFQKLISLPTLMGFHEGTSYKMDSCELGVARKKQLEDRANKDFQKNRGE